MSEKLPPICESWRRDAAKRRPSRKDFTVSGGHGDGGISYTFPPGWDDGSGKIRHVQSGPNKGRVYFRSKREAREVAKRYEGKTGDRATYDH
jgi:hypothetical protein